MLCVFCVFQAPVRSRAESLETLEKKTFRPGSGKKRRKRVKRVNLRLILKEESQTFSFLFNGQIVLERESVGGGKKMKLFSVIKENHPTSIAPLQRYLHLVWAQKSSSSKVNWVLVSSIRFLHFFHFSCYLLCEHSGCARARADIQIHTLSFLCGVRLCLPVRSTNK